MPGESRLTKSLKPASELLDGITRYVGSSRDYDKLLSYYTRQQILFNNWQLGVTYWTIQMMMAAIVIGYVLIYKEGYKSFEQAKGSVVTHAAGDAVSTSTGRYGTRYFGIEDLTYPGLENGNVFVATRQTVQRQMRGYCEDPDMPCVDDSDCVSDRNADGKGVCSKTGQCRVYSWCDIEEKPEIYDLKVDTIEIWARAFIQFVSLAPGKIFSTDGADAMPTPEAVFSVRDLLTRVQPLGIHYEEVHNLGGLFEVGMRWSCSLDDHDKYNKYLHECEPVIEVKRLDTLFDPDAIGYSFNYAEYIDNDHRLLNELTGLRFLFRTTGVGTKFSIAAAITAVSTSGTLMSIAVVISDLLMLKVYKNKARFNARKFEKSPDFSDYIKFVNEQKAARTELSAIEEAEKGVEEKEQDWMLKFNEDNGDSHY